MIVKVAPIGEKVIEVNVENGTTVENILSVADISHNERRITVNSVPAELSTAVAQEGAVIVFARAL